VYAYDVVIVGNAPDEPEPEEPDELDPQTLPSEGYSISAANT
jgi:hypothetical protein